MRDVENDRSLSNSGRSTPTRGHREVAHKPPSVASPLTTPNESSSTSARALRAIETQDAARRAPGGLSRREVRDDDARRREGTTRGRLGKSARMDGLFPRMEIRLSRTRATTERSTERLTMRARVRFSRAG